MSPMWTVLYPEVDVLCPKESDVDSPVPGGGCPVPKGVGCGQSCARKWMSCARKRTSMCNDCKQVDTVPGCYPKDILGCVRLLRKTAMYSLRLPNKYNVSFDYYYFLIAVMCFYVPRRVVCFPSCIFTCFVKEEKFCMEKSLLKRTIDPQEHNLQDSLLTTSRCFPESTGGAGPVGLRSWITSCDSSLPISHSVLYSSFLLVHIETDTDSCCNEYTRCIVTFL
ncbi:unnamed protein product [Ranitomeya imitator]|uniref:Uncharacterized protein n=1 Tax=Ranitomeya imitator TaxID=111125 RepID=A0ABN9ME99_9NEOB|nr:unnamed protein product [Ranitomeya imitator]